MLWSRNKGKENGTLKKIRTIGICFMIALICFFHVPADAEKIISTEIQGDFCKVVIHASINEDKETLPVFLLKPIQVDHMQWIDAIWGIDCNFPINDSEGRFEYSDGTAFCLYSDEDGSFIYRKDSDWEFLVNYADAEENTQAPTLSMSPEEAYQSAEAFVKSLGLTGFAVERCCTMINRDFDTDEVTGHFYSVLLVRERTPGIIDIPDMKIYENPKMFELYGDHLYVFITDEGIQLVSGYIRDAEPIEEIQTITPEEAVEIAKDNIDYVNAFADDGVFSAEDVRIMYLPIKTENGDIYCRPVWRIASGIAYYDTTTFVLYIDAQTGEAYF